MKYFIPLLFVTTILVSSCKKEEETVSTPLEEKQTTEEVIAQPVVPNQVAPVSTVVDPSVSIMRQNGSTTSQQNPMITSKNSTNQPVKVAAGMNPSHGQAGHRCDIAVGAPLNSKPSAAPKNITSSPVSSNPATITKMTAPAGTTTTVSSSQKSTTPSILNPASATTVTAPGMNPPHGQEGHKCEVAVGAPLPKS